VERWFQAARDAGHEAAFAMPPLLEGPFESVELLRRPDLVAAERDLAPLLEAIEKNANTTIAPWSEGAKVEFESEESDKGPRAVNVQLI
jgi:hypothetical protein